MTRRIIAFVLLLSMTGTIGTSGTFAYSAVSEDRSALVESASSLEDDAFLMKSELSLETNPALMPAETSEITENVEIETAGNDELIEAVSENQEEPDQEAVHDDFTVIEKATFTKGMYRDNIYFTGKSLRNYLFSLKNRDFNLAVNQMDLNQAGSLNGVVDPIQGSMIGEAMIHTGFVTSDYIKRSSLRSFFLSAVEVDPEWPEPGAIYLDKNAKALGDNTWEMELVIKGKDFEATNDIVLVIDNSNNVGEQDLRASKTAAVEFGEALLSEGSMTRIAVVKFAGTVLDATPYYNFSNLADFKTYINNIAQQGGNGSNLQAGIHRGDEILYGGDLQNQKNMVILGSRESTLSFPFVGTHTTNTCTANHNSGNTKPGDVTISNPLWPVPLKPDYNMVIGSGSQFTMSNNAYVDVTCQHGYIIRYPYGNFDVDENFTLTLGTDNGVGTIWEARQTREKGTNVFSIAFNAGINGEKVLRDSASNSSNFYSITKNDDIALALKNTFASIASKTTVAAENGTVTDPMGELVDLIFSGAAPVSTNDLPDFLGRQADIYISQGVVSYSAADETITWDVGNINEGEDAVMKYRITLEKDAVIEPGEWIYPNGSTTFSYRNYGDVEAVKNFQVPRITVGGETVYLVHYRVNEEGYPINSAGIVVPLENAERLESEEHTAIYGTYEFIAEQFEGYMYYGYILNGQQIKDVKTVSITTTEAGGSPRLWFGYYKSKTSLKVTKDGSLDENQSFLFKVQGNEIDLTVTIMGNGSVIIMDLPAGEYTVKEVTDWSYRYSPDQAEKTVTTVTEATEEVVFVNTRTSVKWLSGDSWLKNIFARWAD